MADSQERTEEATEKRMKEVRSKGQLAKSQDITAWVGVGAAAVMIPSTITHASAAATGQLSAVTSIVSHPDPGMAVQALEAGLGSMAGTIAPMFAVVAVSVLAASAVQGGIHVQKFKGHFEQFNLLTGLKRTFGTQALWNGTKTLAKTAVVALVLYSVIQGLLPVLTGSGSMPVGSLIAEAAAGVSSLVQFAVFAGLTLAAADVFVVMRRNRKKTRMTKKEVTDENKNSEGDPLVKSQRRTRQLAMSRNRMIAAVAGADVVLLNPTHIAVALKYEPGKSAPRVVAKGSGMMAARIREEAETKSVPMIRDIPLARALHAACEVGHEIPAELYTAVARILAFVMQMNSRGSFRRIENPTTSFLTPEASL
jgi:flagellar biosynthetic protein FlhB